MGFFDRIRGRDKTEEEEDIGKITSPLIFISYGSYDKDIAYGLCGFLEDAGIRCWISPRDIKSQVDYPRELADAIASVRIFVLITSEYAYRSVYIKNELEAALKYQKPVIAYRTDETLPEDEWTFFLNGARLVDAYPNPSDSFEKILPVLREEFNSQGLYRIVDMSRFKRDSAPSTESPSVKKPFRAYDGDEPYIFVSYAHKDAELVFEEIRKFHDRGYPIWYDQGLTPGQEWDEEIAQALMDCRLLVVFISKNSMASKNVHDEIKMALNEDIDIVPVYLEDTELTPALKLRLSNKHAIFKYLANDSDYLSECFKAFDKAGIPRDGN